MIVLPWLIPAGYVLFLVSMVVIMRSAKRRGRAERAADAQPFASAAPRPPARPAYPPTIHLDQAHDRPGATARSVR
ncbi:hypothetical protein B4N89_02470 [Embleya scabrispora]|uniref:Uncharacterized protein n=1 Tax=Embleya scabrispora TaxID=159449 RepID=A0A1T3NTF2_9ACTN|nr:hypothetical protein [Embleya scabrispora]OPC79962.1 hypothetical protein B4N89_02470 [Embleya scabrispora]